MNFDGIKEELRNKPSEVWAAATASAFVLLVAGLPSFAALGTVIVAAALMSYLREGNGASLQADGEESIGDP